MTDRNLRDLAAEFRRVQALFARARTHRERLAFQERLTELLDRIESPPPRQRATATVPHDPPPDEERARFDQLVRDLLVRVHGRAPEPVTRDSDAYWSPEPIVGYRMWHVHGDSLVGARTAWDTPHKVARCLKTGFHSDEPVPHDDGVCPRPGCGIYAMKQPGAIGRRVLPLLARGAPAAVGSVALSGRVVEHELGYRAQLADAVAMALIRPRGDGSAAVVKVDDPHELRNVFAGSTGNRSDLVAPISAALKTGLAFVVPA